MEVEVIAITAPAFSVNPTAAGATITFAVTVTIEKRILEPEVIYSGEVFSGEL